MVVFRPSYVLFYRQMWSGGRSTLNLTSGVNGWTSKPPRWKTFLLQSQCTLFLHSVIITFGHHVWQRTGRHCSLSCIRHLFSFSSLVNESPLLLMLHLSPLKLRFVPHLSSALYLRDILYILFISLQIVLQLPRQWEIISELMLGDGVCPTCLAAAVLVNMAVKRVRLCMNICDWHCAVRALVEMAGWNFE